jgi:enolase
VALTSAIGDKIQIVGDDLFVTNPSLETVSRRAPRTRCW